MDPFEQARNHFFAALEHHNNDRLDEAGALYRKALALMPERVSVLVNLAAVLVRQQRPAEALEFCERALTIEPGHPDALSTRALCNCELSGPEQALQILDQAIAANPRDVEARNNRGVVLRDLGRLQEALDSYDRALALSPDHVGVLSNRGGVLARLGRVNDALASYKRALQLDPQCAPAGAGFIHLVLESGFAPAGHDPEFEALVVRAISEPWARPVSVVPVLTTLLRSDPVFSAWLERVSKAWPERLPPAETAGPDLDPVFRNRLLTTLLKNAVIPDMGIERLLTGLRWWLLQQATAEGNASEPLHDVLVFHCALAMQCHANDYLYGSMPDEHMAALRLRDMLAEALDTDRTFPIQWLVATATYFPLTSLPSPERLLGRPWPKPVQTLLARVVQEPLLEQQGRLRIPRLTAIENKVSRQVQQQYEENPYPRWVSLVRSSGQVSLRDYLRNRVPGTTYRTASRGGDVVALNAGCGTGQQPIDTALRLAGAQVLAIDLSMASLCYASRMANQLGLSNIQFAQADILKLTSLRHRFDLIESTGVLHHMDDPAAGLGVLASLLKPDGVMRLALYSETARRSVAAARVLIAARGYAANADDIRRCRHEIMALDEGAPEKRVTAFSDFYSISECRDLLFHVREHRFTIPAIKRLLDSAGLRLIGFELEPGQHDAFARPFPDPAALADLEAWQVFEQSNPDTFAEMYKFWVCKTGAH